MLVVETIGRIRREHLIKGKPIKAIVRELKVSRNTVRKVLRSGATSFEYARAVQPRPKLGAWHGDLDRMLSDNEGRSSRERLTLIRVFEELRSLGYEGSYDAVRRYAKRWRVERGAATAAAYVPLSFAPGEAYQFDWSHEVVLINGTTVTVKVAHVRRRQTGQHDYRTGKRTDGSSRRRSSVGQRQIAFKKRRQIIFKMTLRAVHRAFITSAGREGRAAAGGRSCSPSPALF
jgi:hypothetical protein